MRVRQSLVAGAVVLCAQAGSASIVDEYLERYFQTFPTAATAAGRHDLDHRLEDLDLTERQAWARFNRQVVCRVLVQLEDPALDFEKQLDLELLLREAERQIFEFDIMRAPQRNPLFWTRILSNATVFLLVRDDLPRARRLTSAAARADQIPRLVDQARQALGSTVVTRIAPELCHIAARQAKATASFYGQGFAQAAGEDAGLRSRLQQSGSQAGVALHQLAEFLDELADRARGDTRLGELYPERFRLVTGVEEPVESVLAAAERALAEKLEETAAYGRTIWAQVMPGKEAPAEATTLVSELFARVSADRARTTDEFVDDYRNLVDLSVEFVRHEDVITLPEPLTLHLGRSPSFFLGQSVGGVYPAGPYAPDDAKTLLLLPTPPDDASPEQADAFFRDFNHHFNLMITPHELVPGHYLQLKYAARHPHKVRALFGDGVYIEGWGTFCERLMLDLGWGEPLDRIAHLKKQLENIARTLVDIRVHTRGMSRDEVLRFVQDEALQDQQFAANMWRRALTSSPQLTFYYLGYREVWGLYQEAKEVSGSRFDLKTFMNGMMELGPVAVRHYRQKILADADDSAAPQTSAQGCR